MQALAWLLPMTSLFSPSLAGSLMQVRVANDPLIAGVGFAAVYTLGVLVDTAARGAALFVQPGRLFLRFQWVTAKADLAYPDARVRIAAKESKLDALVNYYVVRMRVLRGIAFNSNLAAFCWLLVAISSRTPAAPGLSRTRVVGIGVAALAVGVASAIAFGLNQAGYERRIKHIERIADEAEEQVKCERAAAV